MSTCRVCYEDFSRDELMSPCHCKGTIAFICQDCWSKCKEKCTVCTFECLPRRQQHTFVLYDGGFYIDPEERELYIEQIRRLGEILSRQPVADVPGAHG